MPIHRIMSLDDSRLAPFLSLKKSNATRWSDTFVAEGAKLVERTLAAGVEVVSVLLSEREASLWESRFEQECQVNVAPDALIPKIVGFNFHRGVLVCARRPKEKSLEALVPAAGQPATLILCPDVQDPENLGAIYRLADVFGANAVLLGYEATDPFSRRVLRVSMGSALRVATLRSADLSLDITRLKSEFDTRILATVVDSTAIAIDAAKVPGRVGLLFGSEGHGLPAAWVSLADERVTIPMHSGVDSLNVAVAAAICLYQINVSRRRRAQEKNF